VPIVDVSLVDDGTRRAVAVRPAARSRRHLKREVAMRISQIVRQSHRWVSLVFTLLVVVNFVVMALMEPPMWVNLLPLPPLFLLIFSGMYLFVLPFVAERQSKKEREIGRA